MSYIGNAPIPGGVYPEDVSDKANTSTGSFSLPSGTTAQRPSPATGQMVRKNVDTGLVEYYDPTTGAWSGIDPGGTAFLMALIYS